MYMSTIMHNQEQWQRVHKVFWHPHRSLRGTKCHGWWRTGNAAAVVHSPCMSTLLIYSNCYSCSASLLEILSWNPINLICSKYYIFCLFLSLWTKGVIFLLDTLTIVWTWEKVKYSIFNDLYTPHILNIKALQVIPCTPTGHIPKIPCLTMCAIS